METKPPAAVALADLIADPIASKSADAAVRISGDTSTKVDIYGS